MAVCEKRSLEETVHNAKNVLLDIEGTTTSISFVKDTLFPYVRKSLESYVTANWDKDEFKEVLTLLREQATTDVDSKVEGVVAIPSEGTVDEQQAAVVSNVLWQMDNDRKTTALKQLQGLVWRLGYKDGELKGHVYPDVAPALRRWTESGRKLYVYSSGSVEAQKLLFKYSQDGDLSELFSGHFDTTVGPKVEADSYKAIVKSLDCNPDNIIFLTDVPKEASAAREAGLPVVLVTREGAQELSADEKGDFSSVSTLEDVVFSASSTKRQKVDETEPKGISAEAKEEKVPEEKMDVEEEKEEPKTDVAEKEDPKTEEPEKMEEDIAKSEEKVAETKEEKVTETKKEEVTESKEEKVTESKEEKVAESKEEKVPETKEEKVPEAKEEKVTESKKEKVPETKEEKVSETKEKVPETKEEKVTETETKVDEKVVEEESAKDKVESKEAEVVEKEKVEKSEEKVKKTAEEEVKPVETVEAKVEESKTDEVKEVLEETEKPKVEEKSEEKIEEKTVEKAEEAVEDKADQVEKAVEAKEETKDSKTEEAAPKQNGLENGSAVNGVSNGKSEETSNGKAEENGVNGKEVEKSEEVVVKKAAAAAPAEAEMAAEA